MEVSIMLCAEIWLYMFEKLLQSCFGVMWNWFSLPSRFPWGDEAFEKAKQEDKPIFLSGELVHVAMVQNTLNLWCIWNWLFSF